jgi:HK97 family phage portal protein
MIRGLLQRWFGFWPQAGMLLDAPSAQMPYVTAVGSMQHTAVFRACTLIANDLARVPLTIDDATVDALIRSPNRYMSGFELRRTMTLQAALLGNSFALINRTRSGELLELMPLQVDSVTLDITGREPLYRSSQYGDLAPEQVLHLRTTGYNGLWGESPARICRTSLTTALAQERAQLNAMQNGGQSKLAFIHPSSMSEPARQKLSEAFMNNHAGADNAGRPIILHEGMRVERIASSVDQSGIDMARKYSVADVSRIFGVPVSYLSEHSSQPYGSMEWLGRMYVEACLAHWFAAWQSEIETKLVAPLTKVAFDADSIMRPSLAEQMAALRTGVESGVITRNEARGWLDLEPLDGLDEPIVAKNMGAGGGTTNIGADTSEEAGTPNDF